MPALHTLVVGPEGAAEGGTVAVARIVDDFFITAPRGHPVMGRLHQHLREAFGEGVKWKDEPGEIAGYTWLRDRRRRLLCCAAALLFLIGLAANNLPLAGELARRFG